MYRSTKKDSCDGFLMCLYLKWNHRYVKIQVSWNGSKKLVNYRYGVELTLLCDAGD